MDLQGYEREGRAAYAALATTAAAILTAAIRADGGYRLQQVNHRAKQAASLLKKLEQRGIAGTTSLEDDIKDLAGCRVIFYTNRDVTRFISSGIIDQNFEVLETKIHHPARTSEDAAELYISNHYVARLRPDRTALPEYAHLAGMRCEIQIQTILNHAWAEMAHDTIYKAPALADFGGKAFDAIRSRMQRVARKYLVPAGYEFQKIANDFQRLVEGKALFDSDALEAVIEAADNNRRADALETLAENVLPFYDDLQAVYPEIAGRLVAAAERARTTPPAAIETPYGGLPPKTYGDILKAIAKILSRYRYLDIDATFDALCKLYGSTSSEDERQPLLNLAKELSEHQIDVWRQRGPIVQAVLLKRIDALDEDDFRELGPMVVAMLAEVLGTEVSGTTSSSSSVTFHRGAVVASETLRGIRTNAISLLKRQFAMSTSDKERRAVMLALAGATRHPSGVQYTNALALLLMDDTRAIIEFHAEIAPTQSLDVLQMMEDWVHRCYWRYSELPESMRDDPDLVGARARVAAAALAFREIANANLDFGIYKILVGFNSVYTPAWEDKEFGYMEAEEYRIGQVDALLACVDEGNSDVWLERISRYARTESDDLATFPIFGKFLERLGAERPAIAMNYLDRLAGPLGGFLPVILAGLMRSTERTHALARIDAWLGTGQYIRDIAWYLQFADPFDEDLLRRALESAIRHGDARAVRHALRAAVRQFEAHPGTLIEQVFLPALGYLNTAGDITWVRMPWFTWLNSKIIRALDEGQAGRVLDALVPYPELEHDAEYIAAAIAERWPAAVVAFIGKRQTLARTDDAPPRYDAVPFEVHELKSPLAAAADTLLNGARAWFDADQQHFQFEGARLIASVFPDLSNGLEPRLVAWIAGGKESDLAFVLGVLSAFEGKPCIYGLVRAIVAALDPGSSLLRKAEAVLDESGVVRGEFGFSDLLSARKVLLEEWLTDPSERVRTFAANRIRSLDQWIAAETRSAEASIATRRLEYGEDLDAAGAE